MTNLDGLPQGWVSLPLADAVSPRGEKASPQDFPDYPFLGMDHVEAQTGRIIGQVSAGSMKSAAARFRAGDVLYGRLRPYLNKVARPSFDGLASAEFMVFPENGFVLNSYLMHRLRSRDFVSFSSHLNEGDRPRVDFNQIGAFSIEVPPLPEQHRIVAKIEALFSELDAGQDSLTRAQAQLKLYRQSLLKAAFQGRLTADWRKANPDKLEPPETLLARIRAERDARYKQALDNWQTALTEWRAGGEVGRKPAKPKRPDDASPIKQDELDELAIIPESWSWVRPVELAAPVPYAIGIGPFGSNLKVSDYQDAGVPLVFVRNITRRDFTLGLKFVTPEKAEELAAHSALPNDILITKMGDPPGDCAIYPADAPMAIITADCLKFRVWDDFADRRFISYAISSTFIQKQLGLLIRGVAQKKISVERFKTIALPLPPMAEQRVIGDQLDAAFSSIDAIETEITTALAKLSALRQSILKKAFSGQLVPQDPTDEPAAALLSRLRDAAPKEKPRRKVRA